jgi:hydrogenase maturation protease
MTASPTSVLGVGNILWADEGFGVRCVETLERDFAVDKSVTLLDGGTRGLALLEPLAVARRLILFDAVAFGGMAGELKVVRDREVPRFLDQKALSLHQTGLQEILALAELQGWMPDELVCIGVEPMTLEDYGGGLSPPVAAQIEPALNVAVDQLRAWGHRVVRRPRPLDELTVNVAALQRGPYERDRPRATDACRIGDARFMPRGA